MNSWTASTLGRIKTMLDDANQTLNRERRMAKLVLCEQRLLRAMPLIPFYRDTWASLRKLFVRGLTNLFDTQYARIDHTWRAA